nr:hypothetical protein [Lysinibacillus timonensis]
MSFYEAKLYILLLIFSTVAPVQASVNSENNKTYNYRLPMAEIAEKFNNENIEKGNKKKLGLEKEKYKDTYINIKITLGGMHGNNAEISVETILKMNGSLFKGSYHGAINKFEGEDGEYYFGPVEGIMSTKLGNEDSVLGLYFNPSLNESIATVSIGEISEDNGIGMLYFGEYTEKTGEEVTKANKILTEDVLIDNPSKDNNKVLSLLKENLNLTSTVYAADSSQSNPYYHKGTDGTIYLGEIQPVYDDSLPSTYNNASTTVGIMNASVINSSVQGVKRVRLQIFSNTTNVEKYMATNYDPYNKGNDYANVMGINLLFTGSNVIDIFLQKVGQRKGPQ